MTLADMQIIAKHSRTAYELRDALLSAIEKLEFPVQCKTHGPRTFGVCSACQKIERDEMERQYSKTLGRLAELCDCCVPALLAADSNATVTQAIAAEEIMQYLESVRP